MPGNSARDRIRAFLEANVGKVVTTQQVGTVAGIQDYQRRIRELRDEEGMEIRSYRDDASLKPSEYRLDSLHRRPVVSRGISPQLRTFILERNGFTCQLCGRTGGDTDPTNPARKVQLVIDHETPISQGGSDTAENLRVLCSACNHGRSNIEAPSESAKNLLARVRKAPRSVQREILVALKRTFERG